MANASQHPERSRPGSRYPVSRFAGAVKLAVACLLVFVTCGPSVDAQDETPAAFFRADRERMQTQRAQGQPRVVQRPTRMIRNAAPVRGYARVVPHVARDTPSQPQRETPVAPDRTLDDGGQAPLTGGVPASDGSTIADAAAPARVGPAKPGDPAFTVAVIGDSLGQMLGQGLTEAFADKPEVAILRKARENTGLVREDYYDWTKTARDLASGADKINLVVMMIGSNDRQVLRDGGASVELRSPRWLQIYGDRVEGVAQIFRDKKIPVLWVGLPVMKNDRLSADMAAFNEIFKERASRAGAIFVDSWEAFLDDRGLYAAYGPDVNGQFQKLRSGDGVHFTKPGARKLAYFLESEIRRAADNGRPKPEAEIAALTPGPAPSDVAPAKTIPLPPARGSGDPLVLAPLPPVAPQVVIPVKPAEGAVMALNAPALSPGGQLVARARPVNAPGEAAAVIDRVLVQGRPPDARPGRADDFSWPRR